MSFRKVFTALQIAVFAVILASALATPLLDTDGKDLLMDVSEIGPRSGIDEQLSAGTHSSTGAMIAVSGGSEQDSFFPYIPEVDGSILALQSSVNEHGLASCATTAPTPKTDSLCKDLNYLRTDAVHVQGKIHDIKKKVDRACTMLGKVIQTCDKIVKIRDQSCKADPVLTAAKMVPVAFVKGPASKIQPVNSKICKAAKKQAKCKEIIGKLQLKTLNDKCPKVKSYLKTASSKSSEATAWLEDSTEIWCSCKTKNPQRAASVLAGCKEARPNCPAQNKWICPQKLSAFSNVNAIAKQYKCCIPEIRLAAEAVSDCIDDDIRKVVTVIKRTKEVVNKAINWADFVDKMLILGNPDISASVDKLSDLMGPLHALIEEISLVFDRDITVRPLHCGGIKISGMLQLQQHFNQTANWADADREQLYKQLNDGVRYLQLHTELKTLHKKYLEDPDIAEDERLLAFTEIEAETKKAEEDYHKKERKVWHTVEMNEEADDKKRRDEEEASNKAEDEREEKELEEQETAEENAHAEEETQEADGKKLREEEARGMKQEEERQTKLAAKAKSAQNLKANEKKKSMEDKEQQKKADEKYHQEEAAEKRVAKQKKKEEKKKKMMEKRRQQAADRRNKREESALKQAFKQGGSQAAKALKKKLDDKRLRQRNRRAKINKTTARRLLHWHVPHRHHWHHRHHRHHIHIPHRHHWHHRHHRHHIHIPHRHHIHIPHRHHIHIPHIHIPHRHHIHIPHRHHIHIPHRHHIHIPHVHIKFFEDIGKAVTTAVKHIGKAVTTVVKHVSKAVTTVIKTTVDLVGKIPIVGGIIKTAVNAVLEVTCPAAEINILNFLQGGKLKLKWIGKKVEADLGWMKDLMKPIEAVIEPLFKFFKFPTLIEIRGLDFLNSFNPPSFNFDFDADFLGSNVFPTIKRPMLSINSLWDSMFPKLQGVTQTTCNNLLHKNVSSGFVLKPPKCT